TGITITQSAVRNYNFNRRRIMSTMLRKWCGSIIMGLCASTGLVAGAVASEAYPSKPIKLVVPFPAGGPADVMGRIVAQIMSDSLKQSVIVENKPGAGGNIGTDSVAKSAPDGYTVGISLISSLAI